MPMAPAVQAGHDGLNRNKDRTDAAEPIEFSAPGLRSGA
jgi:hypothetical protein